MKFHRWIAFFNNLLCILHPEDNSIMPYGTKFLAPGSRIHKLKRIRNLDRRVKPGTGVTNEKCMINDYNSKCYKIIRIQN